LVSTIIYVGLNTNQSTFEGLRDLNSARRNITKRYILECDEIFAVTEIFRAVTNESVKDVVDLAKRAELSNISIICTKSDVSRQSFG
jgi:hypothetical protein